MMYSLLFWFAAALFTLAHGANDTASAPGAAQGVTGGGNADPVTPTTTAQLISYLTDSSPRVILITKTFDFRGSMGNTTAVGCIPSSNTCGSSGQNAINPNDWCGSSPKTTVTYDNAGTTAIQVKSNKSIIGVGSAGVIVGRGLSLKDVTNVIIQNIHITNLNPSLIWGGDAISLVGTDLIWIDHCKISLIGRQMLVTGFKAAGRVTISNTEFDGKTSWSSSCNNKHYWTMLFLGAEDYITLLNNYIHDCSGRAPKVGGSGAINMHAVNNYFANNDGHDFDVAKGGAVLIEGNYFQTVKIPITPQSSKDGGSIFDAVAGTESSCSAPLGRACLSNLAVDSGAITAYGNSNFFSSFKSEKMGTVPAAIAASAVPAYVMANAGIGKMQGESKAQDRVVDSDVCY
ncbi:3cc03f01-e4a9-4462-8f3e-4a6d69b83cb2 [Sclerotinia trifoliorum]|uniref:pectin lyase n=1 Tax=Sclerotinia trifoliorum TaxID=28548 RepID=A0A8H2VLE6_9HELO|nr:3cc03f01-e4a9-4462-8f3e-4a6d69b83cb2 [Sclerotinia trifoliorum]